MSTSQVSLSPGVSTGDKPAASRLNDDGATVISLFDDVVRRFPERTALTFGQQSVSYRELDARARALAWQLKGLGAGRDVLVGLCTERSIEMIVAILAILRAGAAYAPFDVNYPEDRLRYMIADTACPAILTTPEEARKIPALAGQKLFLLGRAGDAITPAATFAAPRSRDLAYAMYTSGSTGRPKGVLVEHRSIVRLVRHADYCRLNEDEVWLHYAPLPFDASTLEIWGALLNGGRLVIAPPQASLAELGRLIVRESVTSIWLTSGLFNAMVDERLEDLKGVRQLLSGGDVLSPAHVERVLRHVPGCTVINGYGPTENTTFTCCHVMAPGSTVESPIPIGRPISGTTVHLLDETLHPVPDGDSGEICAGGLGVARGYHNNPDATTEKFIADPFSADGGRLYRTGDLGRRRPDGTIEFLGRRDTQVKILGHRVELGEIETEMQSFPGIKQACVAVHSDGSGGKRLIGYYLGDESVGGQTELRRFLTSRLPRPMVPALLVPMCAMPLNPNGKIDRSALPKPDIPDMGSAPDAASSTDLEGLIADSWQRILRGPKVGPDDNFFDVGGDSLRLVTVHAELERRLGREIAIVDLFEFTSPRSLARYLRDGSNDTHRINDRKAHDTAKAERQRASFARFQQARVMPTKNATRTQ